MVKSADRRPVTYRLEPPLAQAVERAIDDWGHTDKVRRLWARDATIWTGSDERRWLAWLGAVAAGRRHLEVFQALKVAATGFRHCLLLGMGGSSLGPEVLARTFGRQAGAPELLVLDSTDPAQVLAFERRVDLAKTLFIVSSKSGSTLEPNIFKQYFFARAEAALGAGKAGAHFIAITDPGSKLEAVARRDGFRWIFSGDPEIGGRYSVLSNFGLVPAAAMGLDVGAFLARADEMVQACGPDVPARDNPGLVLGAALGVLGKHGRDKVTVVASPGIAALGAWLEQLIAESTGKDGKGLIPVDGETLAAPALYGSDRVFAYLRLEDEADPAQDRAVAALEAAGQPVLRLSLRDRLDLAGEFFRWEFATAVAGAIVAINPFDQPDVEASKVKTRELTDAFEKTGHLPAETPVFTGDGIALFTDARNEAALRGRGAGGSLTSWLAAHLGQLGAGDYAALLAYLEQNAAHTASLQHLRYRIRDAKHVATCLGFGPRFLHSTGQAYKGGPNSGVFLQVTCDDAEDLAVPGQSYGFGTVKAAQARGDFDVLAERGRRALRLHLGRDVAAGLAQVTAAVKAALG